MRRWKVTERMLNGNSSTPIVAPDNPPITTSPKKLTGLSRWQVLGASAFLISWLSLFAGGITVDTTRYRCAISPNAARVLALEGRPDDPLARDVCKPYELAASSSSNASGFGPTALAWVAILLFFLPLNLAMVSASAGVLGALGNKANLEHDEIEPADALEARPIRSTDTSSPLMSGLLRGLFVYLFFISGLLLFDDKPFSSPGPGQYIRLAGFLSLISFLVNYRPHLFTTITDWAFARIPGKTPSPEKKELKVENKTELTKTTTVTLPVSKPATNGDSEPKEPAPAPARLYSRLNWLD